MTIEDRETFAGEFLPLSIYDAGTDQQRAEFLALIVQNSNAIEGIFEELFATSMYQINHLAALESVIGMARAYESPSELLIQETHLKLMEGLLDSAGRYRTGGCAIVEGKNIVRQMPDPEEAQKLMTSLESDSYLLDDSVIEVTPDMIWNIHHKFLVAHPFEDGNGRTARLLFNWLSIKHLDAFHMFFEKDRDSYYDAIREYESKTPYDGFTPSIVPGPIGPLKLR